MAIRTAELSDIEELLALYAYAREQMRQNGNPTQWGATQPSREILERDIKNRNLYIIQEDGQICGAFAFLLGEEPTYQKIAGKWLNHYAYGTVHRVAGNGRCKGVFARCIAFCASIQPNIRIDTHADNWIMQRLLEKNGFARCGIVHVDDGSARIAYQRCDVIKTGLESPDI